MSRLYLGFVALLIWATSFLPSLAPSAAVQREQSRFAKGKPEHVLSGIDVPSTLDLVIARYGSPNKIIDVAVDDVPPGRGERDYIWHKGSVTVSVTTAHYLDENRKEVESSIYAVEVMGSSPQGEIGQTGAGLVLGDARERAEQIYGPNFYSSQVLKSRLQGDHFPVRATEWEDGRRLCIALDKRGRIEFMTLVASVD